jgi:hypothetical protein
MQWLKFGYFLRSFMETAYLIRMITSVFADMTQFLIVLFITVMAFGDAFSSVSTSLTLSDDP